MPADQPRRRLRVALLLESLSVPQWVRHSVDEVLRTGVADVVAVAVNGTAPAPPPSRLAQVYARLDQRLFGGGVNPFRPVDLKAVVGDVAVVEGPAALAALRPDAVLDFTSRPLEPRWAGVAPLGLWRVHHGDGDGVAGLREMHARSPVVESTLRATTADGETVRYRSVGRTDDVSALRGSRSLFWKGASFPARALRDATDGIGTTETTTSTTATSPVTSTDVVRLAQGWAREQLRDRFRSERWVLGFHLDPGREQPDVPVLDPAAFRAVEAPPDRFWADPFPVAHDGGHLVFVEELVASEGRGTISVLSVDRDGHWGEPVRVLEAEHHLSYPFVFRWRDDWYLVPESGGAGNVTLHRAERFPDRWVPERVLLDDVRAVDTTLAEIDGRWWLFANIAATRGASTWDELHLHFAESPLGPWQPHPRNPVKSDVRSARPAGRLFWRDGAWHRPAQDCSVRYGYAVVVNRIDRIDPDGYEETAVERLLPGWLPGAVGTHTLNAAGGLTVVDARLEQPLLPRFGLPHRRRRRRPR